MSRLGAPFVLFLALVTLGPASLWADSPAYGFLLRTLAGSGSAAGSSERRIASGRELGTDNPANEAIYQALETQVRGLGAQIANDSDMLSFYRFEDAMLNQVLDLLQRIRSLAIRRGDPALDGDDRALVENEMSQGYEDIVSTLSQAQFNEIKPFAALLSRAEGASWFARRNYYELASIDALMADFIRERSIVGGAEASGALRNEARATVRENDSAQQSLTDTDISSELSALQREDLRFLVDLFLLR